MQQYKPPAFGIDIGCIGMLYDTQVPVVTLVQNATSGLTVIS